VLEYFLAAARRSEEEWSNLAYERRGEKESSTQAGATMTFSEPIVHWYSGPMDILRALVQFGVYSFTKSA
jgi:hypothetical protein